MEEDIEILEEFIECSKDIINDMEYVRPIDVTITVDDIQAIENLINRNKELEEIEKAHQEENGKLREKVKELEEENRIILNSKVGVDLSYDDYIPKSVIKEKIEELKPYIYQGENAPQDFLQYRVKAKIQVLQELLEKEK